MSKINQFIQRVINHIKFKQAKRFKGSDEDYLKNFGKFSLGYDMDLENPTTFNEKLNWYKLNYKSDLMPMCSDKVEVDNYVKEKGLEKYLIKKLAVWDNVDDIDISNLPNQFVIKTNHDSGGIFICKDKSKVKLKDIKKKIKKYYVRDYADYAKEWPYGLIHKKIFAEEFINTKGGHAPTDYKFFCFYGEPKFLFVATDRDSDVKFDFFDIKWNWIDVRQHYANANTHPTKPKNYEKMLEICRILSKDFPHVRVDLYNEDGVIKFGELTFFHYAALTKFEPEQYDKYFGDFFDIEPIKNGTFK